MTAVAIIVAMVFLCLEINYAANIIAKAIREAP